MSNEDVSGEAPQQDDEAQAAKEQEEKAQEEKAQEEKAKAEDLQTLEEAENTVVSSFKDFEDELLQALPE